ncbi:MAG: tRNA (adenosine(37)-N6)-threonylcarbamoyltransferase complex dimerization subunit type 1 TsaB [Francisellaceae bacterium]
MNIIAIDTSTQFCSVSLSKNNVIYTITEDLPRQHNERLLNMIDEVLTLASVNKSNLGLIAYGRGPGSFVGVRLSAAVVQAMAYVLNCPVVGFSSLSAIAHQVFWTHHVNRITVLLDARMGDAYVGYFEFDDSGRLLSVDECCQEIDSIDTQPSDLIVGDRIAGCNMEIDIDHYCPDTQFMFPEILSYYHEHPQVVSTEVLPVYLQGLKNWKKLT